ncbi:MAG: TrkH family potassium uptake protein [Clostridia bacterium]|nr:TrkH family potassium uptake protein [Clostridia bacterium]
MNYRAVSYYLGVICKIVGVFLVIPMIASLCYREFDVITSFVYTALIYEGVGFLLSPVSPKNKKLGRKEGLITVGLSWILISSIGAFVFVFSGAIPNYYNALFETISGFTTTGATVINDVESLSKGVLLWRSLTHWIGGMGILVFLLAVLPNTDGSAFQLMRFEAPGPQVGKLVSKVRHSAAILYVIYFGLTMLEMVFLLFGNIGFFDSLNVALSTAGTGGFAVHNTSILAYDSLYVEIVVIVFMLIFSINFNVYYLMVLKKFSTAFKDEEFRIYIIYVVLSIVGVALAIMSSVGSFGVSLRHAAFAVVSLASSTGFTTVDFSLWSEAAKAILTISTILGACAGSTGGGLKFSRFMVVVKASYTTLLSSIRPNSVHIVKLNKKAISREDTEGVVGYFLLYILVIFVSVFALSVFGHSFSASFYTTIAMFNNTGPCIDASVGATSSYLAFDWGSKTVMMLNMLIGRLEIFPILFLFSPKVWSRKY